MILVKIIKAPVSEFNQIPILIILKKEVSFLLNGNFSEVNIENLIIHKEALILNSFLPSR